MKLVASTSVSERPCRVSLSLEGKIVPENNAIIGFFTPLALLVYTKLGSGDVTAFRQDSISLGKR
jgi:hypothetical protein